MKYEKIYNRIIEYRQKNKLNKSDCYCETHHIKPCSLYPDLKDDKFNEVNLTAREHYIVHKLLVKICEIKYGFDSKEYRCMLNAFWYICHTSKHKDFVSSRTYENLKIAFAEKVSKTQSGNNHWNYGRHHTDETKIKISKANTGNTWSEERKIKYGKKHRGKNNPNFGHKWSEEQKTQASIRNKGNTISESTKRILSEKFSGAGNPMYGKSSWKNCTKEQRENRIMRWQESMKNFPKDTTKGAKWMFNPLTNHTILVLKDKIDEYIKQGYEFGRIFNNPWNKENREKRKQRMENGK